MFRRTSTMMHVRKYRLVTYRSGNRDYIQLVRDIKRQDGSWTSRSVKHIGLDTAENQGIARTLLDFLVKHASSPDAPIAIGTVDEDFFAGLRLGILLGPLSFPIAPFLALRDLIHYLTYYLARESGNLKRVVDAAQSHLSPEERVRLAKWIKKLPTDKDRAAALFIKWSFES